ncbi:MAG: sigma-70 family RNA polymerase sigma factor [Clostridia bacterium]|nr:sigma-70 family RNA polymerase sigma factor [Clostridia bacterium]
MDKQTFTELVRQNERRLYCVAMSYTGNAPDAADAVQEALLRAWTRRGTLREERLFSTWLMRIVINECKTLLRKRRRMIPLEQLPEKAFQMSADADGNLYAALFSLPEKYRVPLVLSALEGYTLLEIAQMLHLPVNTVKTRVSRARQQLRQEVADDAQ